MTKAIPMTKYALALALLATTFCSTSEASEYWKRGERLSKRFSAMHAWHGAYYHQDWGQPLALVVPPTARMQTSWAWGVNQSEMRPIWHQFSRNYPGAGFGTGSGFYPTPQWPSHTDQFGVYYIRGPW